MAIYIVVNFLAGRFKLVIGNIPPRENFVYIFKITEATLGRVAKKTQLDNDDARRFLSFNRKFEKITAYWIINPKNLTDILNKFRFVTGKNPGDNANIYERFLKR